MGFTLARKGSRNLPRVKLGTRRDASVLNAIMRSAGLSRPLCRWGIQAALNEYPSAALCLLPALTSEFIASDCVWVATLGEGDLNSKISHHSKNHTGGRERNDFAFKGSRRMAPPRGRGQLERALI